MHAHTSVLYRKICIPRHCSHTMGGNEFTFPFPSRFYHYFHNRRSLTNFPKPPPRFPNIRAAARAAHCSQQPTHHREKKLSSRPPTQNKIESFIPMCSTRSPHPNPKSQKAKLYLTAVCNSHYPPTSSLASKRIAHARAEVNRV